MTNKQRLLQAVEMGYIITKEGDVFSHKGNKLSSNYRDAGGYKVFNICINHKTKTVPFHRLQGYQKYGCAVFKEDMVVRHKDGDKNNNSWNNILIGTQSDNMMDIPADKRRNYAIHATKHHIRSDWPEIEADRENGMSYSQLSKKYKVGKGALSYRFNKSKKVDI